MFVKALQLFSNASNYMAFNRLCSHSPSVPMCLDPLSCCVSSCTPFHFVPSHPSILCGPNQAASLEAKARFYLCFPFSHLPLLFELSKVYYFYKYEDFSLHVFMYITGQFASEKEARRGCWISWNWSTLMWATMWVLGTNPLSSTRPASAFDY